MTSSVASNTTSATSSSSPNTRPSLAAVLGEITWLMSQSPRHRQQFFIGDLEWLLMPALKLGQCQVFRRQDQAVGAAVWAFVSPEIEQNLKQFPLKIKPSDWHSGGQVWLIDLIDPFGQGPAMLEELRRGALADYTFQCHQLDSQGQPHLATYRGIHVD